MNFEYLEGCRKTIDLYKYWVFEIPSSDEKQQ